LNVWNRDNRWLRAYVPDGGALYGELDMLVAFGGSISQREAYRLLWSDMLAKFKTHFGLWRKVG
jgi:hypothetical protein